MKVQVNIFSNKEVKQLREILNRLDEIDKTLEEIKKLFLPFRYLPVELEKAVRKVGKSADQIDKKVDDLE